jgi:Transposase DDE domain
MPRPQPLYSWIQQVVTAFPQLSRPQAKTLALYSFGVILAKRCGLNSVAATLKPLLRTSFGTIRSRLQEFYQPATIKSGNSRRQIDVPSCFPALLAWALKDWPASRLALALDATSLEDRFTVLSISVVYRGCAFPVSWKVLRANVKHAWKPEWLALLDVFQASVPRNWTVIVMTDRGLYARWLFQKIRDLGWHPLMRITHLSKFRKRGASRSIPVTALAPREGCRWQGQGVAFPKKLERRLACTLLACWEPGYEGPWFLVTDLGPDQAEGLWYGMRAWIEQGFRLFKRGGWQWQATRMTDPERVERLWLVLAVATCYVLKVGGDTEEREMAVGTLSESVPAEAKLRRARQRTSQSGAPTSAHAASGQAARPQRPRRATGTTHRLVSVFDQGSSELITQLIAGHQPPRPQWRPEPWLELRGDIQKPAPQARQGAPKNPPL